MTGVGMDERIVAWWPYIAAVATAAGAAASWIVAQRRLTRDEVRMERRLHADLTSELTEAARTMLAELRHEVEELQAQVNELQAANRQLRDRVTALEAEKDELQRQVAALETENEELRLLTAKPPRKRSAG